MLRILARVPSGPGGTMRPMEYAFDVRDGLLAVLATASASAASPLHGVEVHDSWPTKGIQAREAILVLDFDGGEVPATMSAAGGSRDETFSLVVELAVQATEAEAKSIRDRARVIANELKRLVREGTAGNTTLGVVQVRDPRVRRYRVEQFVLDRGRECDVSLTFDFTARHRLGT